MREWKKKLGESNGEQEHHTLARFRTSQRPDLHTTPVLRIRGPVEASFIMIGFPHASHGKKKKKSGSDGNPILSILPWVVDEIGRKANEDQYITIIDSN